MAAALNINRRAYDSYIVDIPCIPLNYLGKIEKQNGSKLFGRMGGGGAKKKRYEREERVSVRGRERKKEKDPIERRSEG